jgi:hypothetical protein
VRRLAAQDDISINQFIATAIAEKTAAPLTVEYLAKRGRRSIASSRACRAYLLIPAPLVIPT